MTAPIPVYLPDVHLAGSLLAQVDLSDKQVTLILPTEAVRAMLKAFLDHPMPDDAEYCVALHNVQIVITSNGQPVH